MELTSAQPDFELRGIQSSFEVHAGGPTKLELALYAMLEEMGVEFVKEWPVPSPGRRPYQLDAYDPVSKIGYEADGPLHRGSRDTIRDHWIIRTSEVREIKRYGYRQLRAWLS